MDTPTKKLSLQKISRTLGTIRLCSYRTVCEGYPVESTGVGATMDFDFSEIFPRCVACRAEHQLPYPPNAYCENCMVILQSLSCKQTLYLREKLFSKATSVTTTDAKFGRYGRRRLCKNVQRRIVRFHDEIRKTLTDQINPLLSKMKSPLPRKGRR